MTNEVLVKRLDEIIGDYDTPFFSYLLYSYDLTLNECEEIIANLKADIEDNRIAAGNMVSILEDRFRQRVMTHEKESKIAYLSKLIGRDSDFHVRFLSRYDVLDEDIDVIFEKIRQKILDENIHDFEIRRLLTYYFSNSVKQITYLKDLNMIRGRAYDTLIIRKAYREYPILVEQDIVEIIMEIQGEILDAREFKRGIRKEFLKRCMFKSEAKKAHALSNLEYLVEGSGDSFSKLVDCKGLSRRDGETIVAQIKEEIAGGLIQPDDIGSVFLTKRFNEYNERE